MQSSIHLNLGDQYILAAEDSPVQAKRLKRFLDTNNINCEICSNGDEAFKAALARKPILIISDIIMPGMDGYEFCAKVKAEPNLKDIPVILLTSLSDPLDIIKGLQAGADNFITKPYDEQYLLSRIYYLLANNQMRRIGSGDMVIEIMFQGHKYQINSDKKQILDLLLSVYEAAIHRNEDLIEAQLQLQRSNENLVSANQELEAFARTVSHDLRSPLSGVVGFATLLLADSKNMDDVAKTYLQWILDSGYKMAQLIDDLLQYSRSGLADIAPESIDLSKMAGDIVADLRLRNPERNVTVNIQEGIVVNADLKLIQVVLNNLLGNAWKYSGKVENAEISFGKVESEETTTLFIADNGAGFDMEKAEKLFSPFIRLHSNDQFQGTGVGLSTVKRIIEKHNGSIWAESEKGKGAIFYFTLNA
jgi:two-component system sensor histidine kinase/response regulator